MSEKAKTGVQMFEEHLDNMVKTQGVTQPKTDAQGLCNGCKTEVVMPQKVDWIDYLPDIQLSDMVIYPMVVFFGMKILMRLFVGKRDDSNERAKRYIEHQNKIKNGESDGWQKPANKETYREYREQQENKKRYCSPSQPLRLMPKKS